MNKEELLKLKELIENELEKVDKKSEELNNRKEYVRQKPKLGEEYYYLTDQGRVNKAVWNNLCRDNLRFEIGNCFKTEQEALFYREKLLIKQQLKDLAAELNKGNQINRDNITDLNPYFIMYSVPGQALMQHNSSWYMHLDEIYCLDKNFLDIAKERIGEQQLIKLMKSEI